MERITVKLSTVILPLNNDIGCDLFRALGPPCVYAYVKRPITREKRIKLDQELEDYIELIQNTCKYCGQVNTKNKCNNCGATK